MPIPIPEWDVEYGNAIFRTRGPGIKFVPASAATNLLFTPVNTDGTATLPTGYTGAGGIGVFGVVAAVKTTAGVPADTDFSGATPAIALPPIGTMIWSTSTTKLYVRNAAGSYLASVAFT
jgi:hypothetical protein